MAVRHKVIPRRPYSLARTAARLVRFPERVDRFEDGVFRRLLTTIEMVVVVVGAVVLFKQYPRRGPRVFLGLILACYAFYIGYALVVWA